MEIKYKHLLGVILVMCPFLYGLYILCLESITGKVVNIGWVGFISILWFFLVCIIGIVFGLWWGANKADESKFLNKKIKF